MGSSKDFAQGLAGFGTSSLFNGLSSLFNHNLQKEENERNRQFTREMFEAQIKNNIHMWNLQNQYDLPKNQIERLRQAGINPDLYYGGSSVPASSPISAASPSGSSSGFQPISFGNYDPLTTAQIGLINAQRDKVVSETKGQGFTNAILESDAKYRDALNSGQVRALNVTINNTTADTDLKRSTISQISKNIEVSDQNIKESKARIANLDEDTIGKRIDNLFKSEHWKATIDSLYSNIRKIDNDIEISHKQVELACASLALQAMEVRADVVLKSSQAELFGAQSVIAKKTGVRMEWEDDAFKAEINARRYAAQRSANRDRGYSPDDSNSVVSQVTSGILNAVDAVSSFIPGVDR